MLKGKTAVVTGAAKGIGKAIAVRFAQEGCNIVLNYRSSLDEEVIKEIESYGVRCIGVQGDVSVLEDCENMTKKVIEKFESVEKKGKIIHPSRF